MSRAAIYALPARYEPFGLSILEAALAGCALVIGDLPSLREIWGDAATYVRPGELRCALDPLTDDLATCKRLGAAARERALELTPARMAAAYHALYQELCS
jgi:glycosyltransferase involved in cell wall biosynthesis